MFLIELFIISIIAGSLGAILGLGGGIILIPALTIFFNIDIHYTIGASLIAVIATSSGAALSYIRDKVSNIKIGMFLQIPTSIGAILGAILAIYINPKYLFILLGLVMLYSTILMIKRNNNDYKPVKNHPLSEKLGLNSSYFDKSLNKTINYNVEEVYGGLVTMFFAGLFSGILGIGSGSFKVMAMDIFMKLPIKVSTSTSNFMIGVTAASSAGIYYLQGYIDPKIAAPIALGVLIGAKIGSNIMQHLKNKTIRYIFIPVVLYGAIEMLVKGFLHG